MFLNKYPIRIRLAVFTSLGVTCLFLLHLGISMVFFYISYWKGIHETLQEERRELVYFKIKPTPTPEKDETLQSEIREMYHQHNISIRLLDVTGKNIMSSGIFIQHKFTPKPMPNKTGFYAYTTLNQHYQVYVSALQRKETPLTLELWMSQPPFFDEIKRPLVVFIVTYLLIILGTVPAIFYFSRRLTKPIIELKEWLAECNSNKLNTPIIINETYQDELTQLIQEINKVNLRLHNSFERLSQFSLVLAHEIRTPLTLILHSESISNEQEKSALITQQIHRITTILDTIKSIHLLSENAYPLEISSFKLAPLISTICQEIRHAFPDNPIRFNPEKWDDITIEGDQNLITIGLKNIIENAAKHGLPSSDIEIFHTDRRVNIQNKTSQQRWNILNEKLNHSDNQAVPELGLQIICAIFKAHEIPITFTYKEGLLDVALEI